MSQQPTQQKNHMYEQRTEEMISPNNGEPTIRKARFLQPLAKDMWDFEDIPQNPFVSEIFSHKKVKKWPFKVHFTGWKKPQEEWNDWYYRLAIKYGTTWIKAGIVDAIHSSLHKVPCNKEIVLGVCEFWCPKTNTFMFPWGEATVTLEDVMVLGGFPVLGENVGKNVEGELVRIVDEVERVRMEISEERKGKEVSHSTWMKHFMEEEEEGEIDNQEGEFEHVAFLSLWLSRFVFPDLDESVIKSNVFPIAAHLCHGTPIALAPVVLANLYHDLTLLSRKAIDPCLGSKKVYVSGLFHIVQLWVCERFPVFGAKLAKPLEEGDPRVARWDNVEFDVSLSSVRSRLRKGEGFRWRPYAGVLENWEGFPFYGDDEQIISEVPELPGLELPSFGQFCYSCELVGSNGKEKYQPHRVAMQLGYDQDVQGECSVSNYFCVVDHVVGFCIPSRHCEAGMTRRYHKWWKESMSRHEETVKDVLWLNREKECGKRVVKAQDNRGHRHDQKANSRSSGFPWRMRSPPIADGPAMFELQQSPKNPVNAEPLSVPLITEKLEEGDILPEPEVPKLEQGEITTEPETSKPEKGEILLEPEISKTLKTKSPEISKANSRESHASVSPGSLSLMRRLASQNEDGNNDVSSGLDNVPLALRISSNVVIKTAPCSIMIPRQASTAAISSQVGNQRSRVANPQSVISFAKECVAPAVSDIDHISLASRLQAIAQNMGTPKRLESYASTDNEGKPVQRSKLPFQTDGPASPTSDADSQITRKGSNSVRSTVEADRELMDNDGSTSNPRNGELEVRVAILERAVAALGGSKVGPKFSVTD